MSSQGDDYATRRFIDYYYFKNCYKMIAIAIATKQQALDVDQKNNFTRNLSQQATIFFIIKEAKKAVLIFSQKTVKFFFFFCSNTSNVKFSHPQLKKLKLVIKNGIEVTLIFSSNVVSDSNDENNFLHKLLLTNTQVFQRLVKLLQMVHHLI